MINVLSLKEKQRILFAFLKENGLYGIWTHCYKTYPTEEYGHFTREKFNHFQVYSLGTLRMLFAQSPFRWNGETASLLNVQQVVINHVKMSSWTKVSNAFSSYVSKKYLEYYEKK